MRNVSELVYLVGCSAGNFVLSKLRPKKGSVVWRFLIRETYNF